MYISDQTCDDSRHPCQGYATMEGLAYFRVISDDKTNIKEVSNSIVLYSVSLLKYQIHCSRDLLEVWLKSCKIFDDGREVTFPSMVVSVCPVKPATTFL